MPPVFAFVCGVFATIATGLVGFIAYVSHSQRPDRTSVFPRVACCTSSGYSTWNEASIDVCRWKRVKRNRVVRDVSERCES